MADLAAAQDASGALAPHGLAAGVFAENRRSRKTFAKAGARLEAAVEDHRLFERRSVDVLLPARMGAA